MSRAPLAAVLRHIRKLAACRTDEELPDSQLLERFATLRLVVAAPARCPA